MREGARADHSAGCRARSTDDLGHPVEVPGRRARGVARAVADRGAGGDLPRAARRRDRLVHPPRRPRRGGVTRVRGTQEPRPRRGGRAAPDLVVANKEENRELDVRRLRERGIAVWVTDIETVPRRSPRCAGCSGRCWGEPADPAWLVEAEAAWCGPVPPASARVVVPVWRDPWMVVGRPTFTADLLARAGFEVSTAGVEGRYPTVDLAALDDPAVADLVLLPGRAVRVHRGRRAGGVRAPADPPGVGPAAHLVRPCTGRRADFAGPILSV